MVHMGTDVEEQFDDVDIFAPTCFKKSCIPIFVLVVENHLTSLTNKVEGFFLILTSNRPEQAFGSGHFSFSFYAILYLSIVVQKCYGFHELDVPLSMCSEMEMEKQPPDGKIQLRHTTKKTTT